MKGIEYIVMAHFLSGLVCTYFQAYQMDYTLSSCMKNFCNKSMQFLAPLTVSSSSTIKSKFQLILFKLISEYIILHCEVSGGSDHDFFYEGKIFLRYSVTLKLI